MPSASSASRRAALPTFTDAATDQAIGRPIPEVSGTDFDGTSVRIAADGRSKILLFLAHWCPHCQREVPVVQTWLGAGRLPAAVDLISIATAIDQNLPNHPPDAWLAREAGRRRCSSTATTRSPRGTGWTRSPTGSSSMPTAPWRCG